MPYYPGSIIYATFTATTSLLQALFDGNTICRHRGTDLKTIQRLGGWESEAAMSRYLHVTTPELATAANKLAKVLVQ